MSTKDIVYIALFAALTAALGLFPPITIPIAAGVPITAQTLGVMLAGGILGGRRGALAMAVFVVLVVIGLPLLAGGRGGAAVLVGPTGGFLLGWIPGAFVIGWLTERYWQKLTAFHAFAFCALGGIAIVYAFGIPWLAIVAEMGLQKAATVSVAFIPGDLIKAAIAATIMVTVKRTYPLVAPRRAIP